MLPSAKTTGNTGLSFQRSREFSFGTPEKRVVHFYPNRNFWNFLVNGKRPVPAAFGYQPSLSPK